MLFGLHFNITDLDGNSLRIKFRSGMSQQIMQSVLSLNCIISPIAVRGPQHNMLAIVNVNQDIELFLHVTVAQCYEVTSG